MENREMRLKHDRVAQAAGWVAALAMAAAVAVMAAALTGCGADSDTAPETEQASFAELVAHDSEVVTLPSNPCASSGSAAVDSANRARKASDPGSSCLTVASVLTTIAERHASYMTEAANPSAHATCDVNAESYAFECGPHCSQWYTDEWPGGRYRRMGGDAENMPLRNGLELISWSSPLRAMFTSQQMVSFWLNNPLSRVRLFDGNCAKAGYAAASRQYGNSTTGTKVAFYQWHLARCGIGGAAVSHSRIFRYPPPGHASVNLETWPDSDGPALPDANGGGVSYAVSYTNETEDTIYFSWRRMTFRYGESGCYPGAPCWDSYDRDWSSLPSGGINGHVRVNKDPADLGWNNTIAWLDDPLDPDKRYRTRVQVCHKTSGACRQDEWEWKTRQ